MKFAIFAQVEVFHCYLNQHLIRSVLKVAPSSGEVMENGRTAFGRNAVMCSIFVMLMVLVFFVLMVRVF